MRHRLSALQHLAQLTLVVCLGLACATAMAQVTPVLVPAATEPPPEIATEPDPAAWPANPWQYVLGLKLKSDDLGHLSGHVQLRPVIGLRYGRWHIGQTTSEDWLRFGSYRKDTGLEYDWKNSAKLKVSLSARIQNITRNEGFDGFSGGRNTLRARASAQYRLTPHWSVGTDLTQDLFNRGDGTTVSPGLSYLWPLDERSTLSLSVSTTWATAKHWQTQHLEGPAPARPWRAGLGDIGAGLNYRYSLTAHWAWFASLGAGRPLGQAAEVSTPPNTWSGQIGLLYFSR